MKFWLYLLIGAVCLQTQSVMANENNDTDLFVLIKSSASVITVTADGKKIFEPKLNSFRVNTAALMSSKFGPQNGTTQDRRSLIAETFEGITLDGFQTSMLSVLKSHGLSDFKISGFVETVPALGACDEYAFIGIEGDIMVLYRMDVERGPFSSLIKKCLNGEWRDEFKLVAVIDSNEWMIPFAASASKSRALKKFSNLFSPSLTAAETKEFFSFGVTNGNELEGVFNRMNADNFTEAADINEDVLLDFLRHEAAGKKEGLSARAYKDKKRAEKIAAQKRAEEAQKRAEERAKKMTAAREKIQIMPVAVCIGAAKDAHTKTLVNLFSTNNRPATVQYMLDAGCTNRWSTKMRGGDLKEFYRYRDYVGVVTRKYKSGVGWIYAVVRKSQWDVPVN